MIKIPENMLSAVYSALFPLEKIFLNHDKTQFLKIFIVN